MKSLLKRFSLLLVMLGFASIANAEEDRANDGFIKRAFRDMKESAKLQRQIDKANFRAVRLETKAFYEEQKRLSKPSVRTAAERERECSANWILQTKELKRLKQRLIM